MISSVFIPSPTTAFGYDRKVYGTHNKMYNELRPAEEIVQRKRSVLGKMFNKITTLPSRARLPWTKSTRRFVCPQYVGDYDYFPDCDIASTIGLTLTEVNFDSVSNLPTRSEASSSATSSEEDVGHFEF